MTQRRGFLPVGILAVLLAAIFAQAGDFWQTKPYTEWDKQEAIRILHNSPWARTVEDYNRDLTVLWFSSRTAREAVVRIRMLQGTLNDKDATDLLAPRVDEYVLLLYQTSYPDLAIFHRFTQVPLQEKLSAEEIQASAYLKPKRSGQKVPARSVYLVRRGTEVFQVEFHFPRAIDGRPVLAEDETEVRFTYDGIWFEEWEVLGWGRAYPRIQTGGVKRRRIERTFKLRKMVRDGKPDL